MDIVVAFRDKDGTYVRHAAAMLASLAACTRVPMCVHILHDETLLPASAARLQAMLAAAGHSLRLHCLDPRQCLPTVQEDSPIMQPLTFATLYRLFIPSLPGLCDCARLVYLDTDIIVDIDISALWNTPLNGALLGAVPDPCLNGALTRKVTDARSQWAHDVARHSLRLGIPTSHYFNAGVLLLDLQAIRAQKLFEQAADIVLRTPTLLHPDQDALNKIFYDKSVFVDKKFNYILHTDVVDGIDTGVWHYSGPRKPWTHDMPKADRYHYFAARTPWGDTVPDAGSNDAEGQ